MRTLSEIQKEMGIAQNAYNERYNWYRECIRDPFKKSYAQDAFNRLEETERWITRLQEEEESLLSRF